MGAPSYLVAAALRGVIAQRLVRRVCERCAHDDTPDEAQRAILEHLEKGSCNQTFKKGVGCQNCNHTGYRGRIGVFELLEMNSAMMDALRQEDTQRFAEAAKHAQGYRSMANVALDFAKQGVTSIDEVLFLAESVEENFAATNVSEIAQRSESDD